MFLKFARGIGMFGIWEMDRHFFANLSVCLFLKILECDAIIQYRLTVLFSKDDIWGISWDVGYCF